MWKAARLKGRRGATTGADVARIRLRKVIMVVRVVNTFKKAKDKLCQLTPISAMRSRSSSPEPGATAPGIHSTTVPALSAAFPCMLQ